MTETLYQGVSDKMEAMSIKERCSSVFGMLEVLSVSRSGYYVWRKRQSSLSQKRLEHIKKKIRVIYHASKKTMVPPKSPKSYVKKVKSLWNEQ